MQQTLPLGIRVLETFSIKQHHVLRNHGFNYLVKRLEKCAGNGKTPTGTDKKPKCDTCSFVEPCKNRFDKVCDRDIS